VLNRAALLLSLAACSAPIVRPEPVVVAGCQLTAPPPERPILKRTPCAIGLCLDAPNAAEWEAYEKELRAWAGDAWVRCGK
jgi:hypothetical protein